MKLVNLIFLLFIINEISCLSRGLYYGKEKCFYDNYYNQMNLVITYKILDTDIKFSDSHKTLFHITLYGMEKSEFKTFYGSKLSGKFSYNIEESDKYKVCIYSSDKEIFKNKKFLHMEFKIQSSDELYDEHSAKAKDFQKVNITMQNINAKINNMDVVQKFELEMEDSFYNNQIRISNRLAFLSILQIVVICIVGLFHVFSLRKLFKDKIWTPF